MKRAFSALIAGAMVAAMAVPAFAATNISATVYNSDGESIVGSTKDVYDTTPSVPFVTSKSTTYGIDGVVPGISMYIPLQSTMTTSISDGSAGAVTVADVVTYLNNATPGTVTTTSTPIAGDYLGGTDGKSIATASNKAESDITVAEMVGQLGVTSTAPAIGDVVLTHSAGAFGVTSALADSGDGSTPTVPADVVKDGSNCYVTTSTDVTNAVSALTTGQIVWGSTAAYTNAGTYYKTTANQTTLTAAWAAATPSGGATATYAVTPEYLTDKDYFKFDLDKDDGSKYISKVEVLDDKKMSELNQRTAFLKITLSDSTTTSDLKTSGKITFKAKADSTSYSGSKAVPATQKWVSGDTFTINYTFWINNVKTTNDSSVETGDRVYFDPDDNEDNTLIWGDDRAGLYFEANDDASKFYARLQTKTDSSIYSEYGDPVDADLWFYDFVGNPTVSSTSRATLTLGIPWDEDDDYTPNAEDCFIYEKQDDGTLKDVTSQFTYDEDNDGTTDIEGWTIKTRTLGTYIISDTELDLDVIDDVVDEEPVDDTTSDVTDSTGKAIPNTGSSDMVGVAMVAAAVSLAAAGAVAFKKASK